MHHAKGEIGVRRKSIALWGSVALAAAIVVGGVALSPSAAFCAAADFVPLHRLADGSLAQPSISPDDARAFVSLKQQAVSRITQVFGAPIAKPKIIFLSDPKHFWPFVFSDFGTTAFAGTRACVIIGADGRNVDVVAHEMLHAEIFRRIGAWRRITALPVWFDEGAAMQVDDRKGFDVAPAHRQAAAAISTANTFSQFFAVSPDALTQHFAFAKAEVAGWLARIGRRRFYQRLEEWRAGKSFWEIWRE